jgi:hypothetical protein
MDPRRQAPQVHTNRGATSKATSLFIPTVRVRTRTWPTLVRARGMCTPFIPCMQWNDRVVSSNRNASKHIHCSHCQSHPAATPAWFCLKLKHTDRMVTLTTNRPPGKSKKFANTCSIADISYPAQQSLWIQEEPGLV